MSSVAKSNSTYTKSPQDKTSKVHTVHVIVCRLFIRSDQVPANGPRLLSLGMSIQGINARLPGPP